MLIPQYSIRWLLGLMTVCSVAFTFVGLAVRGHAWALGISVALGALCLVMLLYAAMFGVLWLFSLVFVGAKRSAGSPFASQAPQGASPFFLGDLAANGNDGPGGRASDAASDEAVDAIIVE